MKKTLYWGFMIGYTLGFAFGVVDIAQAETVYDNSYIGTDWQLGTNEDVNTRYYSNYPSFISIGNPPTADIKTTDSWNKLRVIIKSGTMTCAELGGGYGLLAVGISSTSSASFAGGTVNGIYCDISFATSYNNLYYIAIIASNNYETDVVLEGSSNNEGRTVNGFNASSTTGSFAYQLCNGTCSGGFTEYNPDTTSHIISLTYSTSTNIATGQYYFDTSLNPPIVFFSVTHPLQGIASQQTINATSTGYVTYEFNVPTQQATSTSGFNYTLYTEIQSYDTCTGDPFFGYICTDPDAPIFDSTSTTAVITPNDLSDIFNRASLLATTTCDIYNIDGCFRNFAIWAVYPDDNAKNSFIGLQTILEKKAPIGYFFIVKNSLSSLNGSSTPVFTFLLPDDLKNNIFDPFKISLAIFLWFFFLIHMYKRLKHITI
jgi:hypothetical protein